MSASEIAADMKKFTGAGVITATQLAKYVGMKTAWRAKEKYLSDDPESAVPVVRAISGKKYLIKEVAIRLHESME